MMPVRMALLSLVAQLEPEPVGVERAKAMAEALEAWVSAGDWLMSEDDADDLSDALDALVGKGH